jgi:hypothetical protein
MKEATASQNHQMPMRANVDKPSAQVVGSSNDIKLERNWLIVNQSIEILIMVSYV